VGRALFGIFLALAFTAPTTAAALPPIKHVWVVVLENKDYDDSFGPDTEAPYLARELTRAGQLLPNYFGTSHASLGNYITMVSGQAANPVTQGDCLRYVDVIPGTPTDDGQVMGQGCVYPAHVETVAGQLEKAGFKWRGYMEDMGNTPSAPRTCRHPEIGGHDDTQAAREHDQYATRHNPFVYFHSIIDSPTCAQNVVPLDQLRDDVASAETTPNFAFITPDLCNDGHDETCVDGGPGGLPAADLFLRRWVPVILASPGFASEGLLIVTWDEANITPDSSTACCGQPTGPNTLTPGLLGPGGGRTGTVVIGPHVRPGSVNGQAYNHYGLLRSIEDIFGLPHLGYAAQEGLRAFAEDVFNAVPPAPPSAPAPTCRPRRSGRAIRGLRLRATLLSFRALRNVPVVIRSRLRNGDVVRRRRPRRLRACRIYQLRLPRSVARASVQAGGRTFRVKRGPSGEHDR
jgi:phosphatidylinositol-3-phosphatase